MNSATKDRSLQFYLKQYFTQPDVNYAPVTAQMLSLKPAQLTQDGLCYLESASLTGSLQEDPKAAKLDLNRSVVHIKLIDWQFVMRKPQESRGQYLDIYVKSYEISSTPQDKDYIRPQCINLLDTNPYKRLYDESVLKFKSKQKDESSVHVDKKIGKEEQGSNQAKYSFRSRLGGAMGVLGKESREDNSSYSRKIAGNEDDTIKKTVASIRVSGINGKQNMKKLKEFRNPYIMQSQESITNQVLKNESQGFPLLSVLNGGESQESTNKFKTSSAYLKKRSPEELEETTVPHIGLFKEGKDTHLLSQKDEPVLETSNGKGKDQSGKKIKLSQKAELALSRPPAGEGTLDFEELMDCLSIEKAIMKWDDIVFSKDVVQYLKRHLDDLMEKK